MSSAISDAPGWPGQPARWTSSAKTGVGTSFESTSRVWFTLSHGIFDEIYYPRVDTACVRDLGLIVTNGKDFFSEEKRNTRHTIARLGHGVPGYLITNTCIEGRYRITKEIIADPGRDVVLQCVHFTPLKGKSKDYHVYALIAPHLGNQGEGNTAWTGDYKGVPMLFAQRDDFALALGCSASWSGRSVGFSGVSDGWRDLTQHFALTWAYDRAENGNVAMIGEIDPGEHDFVLALGFGTTALEAGHLARASLSERFDDLRDWYVQDWERWQESLRSLDYGVNRRNARYRLSAAVLRVHEAKTFPGGIIASLSIPWGFANGDEDLGGYHLVWTRDLVEAVGGLLAAGARDDVDRVLRYLRVTQEADGSWPQNMWLDGRPNWTGRQLDEVALPILLTDTAWREGLLSPGALDRLWTMVRTAAIFVVQNGPVTDQDRWEENPGYSPFTLAAEVAALLAAADLAEVAREPDLAGYLRETADAWNDAIERWTYVTGTDLARQCEVDGYYVRIAPPEIGEGVSLKRAEINIKNRPPDESQWKATEIISTDALALVRFGLRAADDPRIVNTVKIIDELLKVETPFGPCWHRYNHDGYGEHADGSPYDGTGIGRAWPLLTGERAHYELAAGCRKEAEQLLRALEKFANDGGMISEQIWDSADIPERDLFLGRPTGSAMPLVWAHAEHLKLRRSLHERRVFDQPPQPVQRYLVEHTGSPYEIWRFNHKTPSIRAGKTLRIEVGTAARIHWTDNDWKTAHNQPTRDPGAGVHVSDLSTSQLPGGSEVLFTFHWTDAKKWEGRNFTVTIEENEP